MAADVLGNLQISVMVTDLGCILLEFILIVNLSVRDGVSSEYNHS